MERMLSVLSMMVRIWSTVKFGIAGKWSGWAWPAINLPRACLEPGARGWREDPDILIVTLKGATYQIVRATAN